MVPRKIIFLWLCFVASFSFAQTRQEIIDVSRSSIISSNATVSINYTNGSITIPDNTTEQKIRVYNNGTIAAIRRSINLIAGTNITFSIADNNAADRADITINGSSASDALVFAALGSPSILQTFNFPSVYCNTSSSFTDGQIRWIALDYLTTARSLTGVSVYCRTAGSYTGDNNNRVGLYSYSAGTLTLVASSTNNATLWTGAANTYLSVPFSTPYSAAPGMYFVALIYNNSAQTTAPAVASGTALFNANMASVGFTNSAKLYGTSNGTDLPASIAMSSITATTVPTWVTVY